MPHNTLFRVVYTEDLSLGEGTVSIEDNSGNTVAAHKINGSLLPVTDATATVFELASGSSIEDCLLKLNDYINDIPDPNLTTIADDKVIATTTTTDAMNIAVNSTQSWINRFLDKKINESASGGGLKEALYLREDPTFDYENWESATIAEGSYLVFGNAMWIAKDSAWDTSAYATILNREYYFRYMKAGDILSFNRLSDKKYIEIATGNSELFIEEGANVFKLLLGQGIVGGGSDLTGNISLHNTKISNIDSSGEVGNAASFYNSAVNADGEITSTDWEQLDVWDGINDSGDDTIVGDKIEYDRSTHVFRNISGGDIQVNVGFASSMIITTDISVNILEFGLLNQDGDVLCSSTNRTDQSGAVTIPQTSQVNKVLSSSNIITMAADDEISLYVRKPYNFGIQLDYTTYDSSITIIEIVGAGKDGLPGPIGPSGTDGDNGVDGSGDMTPVSYRLSAYANSVVTPNTGEVTIETGVGYTLRFNRYDSRGLDNDVDSKYSFFNDVVVGNPLLLVDTITARGYTANEVGSISCIVTSVEYSGDVLIITTDDFDVTGGQSISDIVGRVFVLISAHQLGNQLDNKMDKSTSQTPPPSGASRKLAGMKLNYSDIALKIPNNGDSYNYSCAIEMNLADEFIGGLTRVHLTVKFTRGGTGIYVSATWPTFQGHASPTLSIRGYITNYDDNNDPVTDLEFITDPFWSTGTNYNLTDSIYEYNFYTYWSSSERAWCRVIDESDPGIVNLDTAMISNTNVLLMSQENIYRQLYEVYVPSRSRREYELVFANATEINASGYVKSKANPSSLLYHTTSEALTVSDTLFASPSSASIAARFLNGFVYNGSWQYTGPDVRLKLSANVTYSASGSSTTVNFYLAKDWSGGSPSGDDLLSKRSRETSASDKAAIGIEWSVDLTDGDHLDLVVNKDGSPTETVTILSGTYSVEFVQWL